TSDRRGRGRDGLRAQPTAARAARRAGRCGLLTTDDYAGDASAGRNSLAPAGVEDDLAEQREAADVLLAVDARDAVGVVTERVGRRRVAGFDREAQVAAAELEAGQHVGARLLHVE